MQIIIKDLIDKDHRSHFWYGGQCAEIKHKGYTASIEAIGDMYIEYAPNGQYESHVKDKNNAGWFYNEMHNIIKNDKELYELIEKGDIIVDNNNWWECFIIDPQGNFHDLMWALDADYLDEAIDEVIENFEAMIEYVEENE